MKIVVVEDEIRIREGIVKLIGKLNKNDEVAGEADNGQDGLALIRSVKPDVIITDIKMPVMDGMAMLQHLHEEGISAKVIVLSAYSEFEYARQAIKLGVTEYLLKPLTLPMFSQALENVRFQAEIEKAKKPDQVGTKEQIFRELLYGNITASEEIIGYLKHKFKIETEHPFVIICCYLGVHYKAEYQSVKKSLAHIWLQKADASYDILGLEHYKSIIMVLYNNHEIQMLERWFQIQILNRQIKGSFGWSQAEDISQLYQCFQELFPYMDWNVTMEDEVLVSYPKIRQIQAAPCIYPMELENQAKAALCMYDWKRLERTFGELHTYFKQQVYVPREIKECYVRFFWSLIAVAKELACLNEESLEQERLLELIMGAKAKRELVYASELLLLCIVQSEDGEDPVTHINIKRAKRMISEFYQTGITLEEIAGKLNLTPEYLGTQFHKSVGLNFSTYIRNYRMNKAKELLCSTQLRLYEIAEKVGYSNAKYFSQVFKEYTGMLPAEYRKLYR